MRLEDRIECKLCGRFLGALAGHLRIHRITGEEYKRKFKVLHLSNQVTRYRMGRHAVRRGWGKIAWTEERVLRTIRRLARQGQDLADTPMSKTHSGLRQEGVARFGSWEKALTAAGLDYSLIRHDAHKLRWSREKVIAGIRERRRRGESLHYEAMKAEDSRLLASAVNHMGTWQAAIEAAGYDYAGIRRKFAPPRWTDQAILRGIERLAAAGRSLAPRDLIKDHDANLLYRAARRQFGTWKRALSFVDIDFHDHYVRLEPWTEERVLAAIRAEHAAGRSLQRQAVLQRNPSLNKAVHRFFGGWKTALLRLGMDPRGVVRPLSWTRERVIEEIKERLRQGKPLGPKAIAAEGSGLVSAARARFGGFRAALLEAGVRPEAVLRVRYWTRERVVAGLLERARQGRALGHGDLKAEDPSLLGAACSHFGGLVAARRAAGIAKPARKAVEPLIWTRERVVSALQERARTGKPLRSRCIRTEDGGLLAGARGRFGTYRAALEAAGLDSRAIMPGPVWTRERVVAELQERAEQGKTLTSSGLQAENCRLKMAARRLFGSHNAALQAAGLVPPLSPAAQKQGSAPEPGPAGGWE